VRRLKVPGEVASLIRGLHPDLKRRVRSALNAIVADPSVGKVLRDDAQLPRRAIPNHLPGSAHAR